MNLVNVKPKLNKMAEDILFGAERFGLDPFLVAAVCWQESTFDPDATCFEPAFQKKYIDPMSDKQILSQRIIPDDIPVDIRNERNALSTSWGPMQIMGQTARERGFRADCSHLIGRVGINWGCKHLKKQLKRYKGQFRDAISAYNAGTKTEDNQRKYVDPVMEKWTILANDEEVKSWLEG